MLLRSPLTACGFGTFLVYANPAVREPLGTAIGIGAVLGMVTALIVHAVAGPAPSTTRPPSRTQYGRGHPRTSATPMVASDASFYSRKSTAQLMRFARSLRV